jgi:hypothetical protein
MDVVAQLMPTLKDYPLYPYIEYRQLSQDLSQDTLLGVNNFVTRYPTLPAAKTLKISSSVNLRVVMIGKGYSA